MPNAVLLKMDALRMHGNRAAHGDKIKAGDALWLLQEAFCVGGWLFLTYGNGTKEALGKYAVPQAPKTETATLTKKELQRKLEQLEQAKRPNCASVTSMLPMCWNWMKRKPVVV